MCSLLSRPSPSTRQPRNGRALTGSKPRSAHVTALAALESALAATAHPRTAPDPPSASAITPKPEVIGQTWRMLARLTPCSWRADAS